MSDSILQTAEDPGSKPGMSTIYADVRCRKCNRLLFKQRWIQGEVQIKCPKCGFLNMLYYSASMHGGFNIGTMSHTN